jgi:hypothetical protein
VEKLKDRPQEVSTKGLRLPITLREKDTHEVDTGREITLERDSNIR